MFPLLHRNLPHVEDKILSYLGPKDAASSMLVCREWCQKARPHVYKWYAILLRRKGYIPLQMAVLQGYDHIFAYLLEDKQVDVNERYPDGPTALMTAVKYKNERIVSMLLEREDTDVNIITKNCFRDYAGRKESFGDRTALVIAAIYNLPGMVRMLLERTDILVNARVRGGWTALMRAANMRHVRVCEELLKCPHIDVNIKENGGHTALSFVCQEERYYDAERSLKSRKIMKMLLDKNAI